METITETPQTLKEMRTSANLSIRAAAKKIGLSHARIIQIESKGIDKNSTIERIAAAYGLKPELVRTAAQSLLESGKNNLP